MFRRRDVSAIASSATGLFGDRTFRRRDDSATGRFGDRTVRRWDDSAIGRFGDRTVRRWDFSAIGLFGDGRLEDSVPYNFVLYFIWRSLEDEGVLISDGYGRTLSHAHFNENPTSQICIFLN